MTAHPDLAALLRGDLPNDVALGCAAHTRTCETCKDELADLALGHGMLSAAGRTLGPIPVPEPARPDLPPSIQRRRTPRRRALAAVALAAVLAVAAAATAAVLRTGDGDTGRTVAAEQTVTLEPVQPGPVPPSGLVSMATVTELVTRMRVETADLPRAPQGGFYYVWLFDPVSNKMLPLGQVVPGHRATFDVPSSLITAYSALDISLESDDGDPGHSVTSVLRASYDVSGPSPATPSGSS